MWSLQVCLPGHAVRVGGMESSSGGANRPSSTILFICNVSIIPNYSLRLTNMFQTPVWPSQGIVWMAR